MPRDVFEAGQDLAGKLSERYGALPTRELLSATLNDPLLGRVALVSSFGAESVVLLHLVASVAPDVPVLFLDTEMLFPETLAYQLRVAETLGLSDIRRITPSTEDVTARDPEGRLHKTDPDACCTLRKTEPLERALAGFDTWITGRKRFQGGAREALPVFETDGAGRTKINPLAPWRPEDIRDHLHDHHLPRHPLVAQGYASIGCAPCTAPVGEGDDTRAGRWRGSDKTECGIHFTNGQSARGSFSQEGCSAT